MRTFAAEKLAESVSRIFTNAEGSGTYERQFEGTRKRGSATEKGDRVEILELERILNLDIAAYDRRGKVTTEDDNPFENMTEEEFVLGMGAAREHRPPLIEWACNLRVHRDLCSQTKKGCLCVEHKFPDQVTLFSRSLSPKEAMIDLDLIRIYVRAARADRKRWEAMQRASGRRPMRRFAGHTGLCDACGGPIAIGEAILVGGGEARHEGCWEVAV